MTPEESEYVRAQLEAEYRRGRQDGAADWKRTHIIRRRTCGEWHTDAKACIPGCQVAPPERRKRKKALR